MNDTTNTVNPFARVIYLDPVKTYFMVKTADGYVGRYNIHDELQANVPKGFGYTYDHAEDALSVARTFAGADVVEVRAQY